MSARNTASSKRALQRQNIRRMVMGGMFGAICVVLGVSGIGMIPVPNLSGHATIMHLPVIIAAVLEGPVVGAFTGLIMGIYSFMTASAIPPNPFVAILPRILIGVISAYVYRAFGRHTTLGAACAGFIGTITNTVGYIGMAILMGYYPMAIWLMILPQFIVELILATVLTVALVRVIQRAMPTYRK